MTEGKKVPNYIYKVERDQMPTIYVDCVTKVTQIVTDHAIKNSREVTEWLPLGKWRAVQCVDELGMSIEYDHKSHTKVRDHTFLIEQIEVI